MNYLKIGLVFVLSLFFCQRMCGFEHKGPSYDTKPRYIIDACAERIARDYCFKFLMSGIGMIVDTTANWGFLFTSQQNMTIEEARPIAKDMANRFIQCIYQDPLFAAYFVGRNYPDETRRLSINEVCYKLAFWDANVDRPLSPYLAEIRLKNAELYYYYADPQTQALLPPIIEPL